MEMCLSLSMSPLYPLRHALNKSVLQMDGTEADKCVKNRVWRSSVDSVMLVPDLFSLKDRFISCSEDCYQIAFDFQLL